MINPTDVFDAVQRAKADKEALKKTRRLIEKHGGNPDVVNHPEHYKAGGVETIDYIEAKLTPEEFTGYCRGNALKYISRAGRKDDTVIEIGKAIWYLQRWRDSLLHKDTQK